MSDSDSQSGPLSGEDISSVQIIIAEIAGGCFAMGLYLLLAIMAIHTIIRHGLLNSTARRLLLVAVLIVLISSTILFAVDIAYCIKQMTWLGTDPDPVQIFNRLEIVIILCCRINYMISDIIVVWRAWILSNYRLFRIALAFSMLATIGCAIEEAIVTIKAANDNSNAVKNPLLDLVLIVPLVFTNILATCVIAFQAWLYRRDIKTYSDPRHARNRVERILVLFLESGAIYAAIWILNIIAIFGAESGTWFPLWLDLVLAATLPYVSAIYPTAIILLVARDEARYPTTALGDAKTTSIHFESPRQGPTSHITQSPSIIQSIPNHILSNRSDGESGTVDVEASKEE